LTPLPTLLRWLWAKKLSLTEDRATNCTKKKLPGNKEGTSTENRLFEHIKEKKRKDVSEIAISPSIVGSMFKHSHISKLLTNDPLGRQTPTQPPIEIIYV
jgi:hypothetical protein